VRGDLRRRPPDSLAVSRKAGREDEPVPAQPRTLSLPMRTTWNGSISFGLVNIPVGLSPATAPAARQSDVSFRMLHRECMTPIKQKRWCPVHDVEVGPDEIVRGWEVAKGQFVPVEDEELEALEGKVEGREIAEPVPAAPETPVIDLMEALRASVAASKKGDKAAPARKPAAARKRAAAGRK